MKSIDFLNKFTDKRIPTFVRNIAEKAVNEINEGNFKTVELTEPEMHALCRYAGIKPNTTHGYLWIRIFDEYGNGKDIEVINVWKR